MLHKTPVLVSVICKPGEMKAGTQNSGIDVPIWSQEIIMGTCYELKHQRHCNDKFHPSAITLQSLEKLQIQQEIEEAHNN